MRNRISILQRSARVVFVAWVIISSAGISYVLKIPVARAATTIEVANTADSGGTGPCGLGHNPTLRDAFGTGDGCVNDSVSPDTSYTINIGTGVFETSLTFTIPADTSVTMTGQGIDTTTITSTSTDPFLMKLAGEGAVHLSSFTLTASTEGAYVVGFETPFTGNVSLDHVVINAEDTIPLLFGANSSDGAESTGTVSVTYSTFNANNNGIYFGLRPGMFGVTTPHILDGAIDINNNVFNIDDGTGGIGASNAITFLSAGTSDVDIHDNDINMTGTGNLAGGILFDDFYDVFPLAGTLSLASNSITGTPDFGGGITVNESSYDTATLASNTISGNIVSPNAHLLSLAMDDCLVESCSVFSAASFTNNIIDVTADDAFANLSTGIISTAATSTIAYNSVTLANASGDPLNQTNGITCVSGVNQTCNVSGNIVMGAAKFGIAGIVPVSNVTLDLNVENNLVAAADVSSARGITAQAADYGGGDPEGDTINFNVINNSIVGISNSGGGAIVTDTDTTSIAGDTVNAVIFNNLLQGNAYGIGTITSGGSDEQVTMYNDYNLVYTTIIAPASDNYFGTMSTGSVAAGAHDVDADAELIGPGDFSLGATSPALNTGIATFHSKTAPTIDIAGTDRPQGASYDIGAFETVANASPTANAGSDQYTSINEVNSIDCSGSLDPDEDTLSYLWVQTGGTSVSLTGGATATATFTPTSIGDYTFTCAVNDGTNPTATDSVTVHATAKRIAGSDRYDTAVKISQASFPTSHTVNKLVIASGENYPDALASGPLAALVSGPVLLVQKNWVPGGVATEITRVLKTSDANGSQADIYIVGGTSVISDATLNSIKNAHPGFEVKRLGGTDRVDTSLVIAKEMEALRGTSISFAIASGYNFADAASIAVPAADANTAIGSASNWRRTPVLLTGTTSLDSRISSYLSSKKSGVTKVYISGSTSYVSSSAQTSLNNIFGSSKVTRFSASSHEDVPTVFAPVFYTAPTKVALVTIENFPDVLAAGPYAAALHMPIFYSDNVVVNDTVINYMDTKTSSLTSVYVFGGTAAISNNTKKTLQQHL